MINNKIRKKQPVLVTDPNLSPVLSTVAGNIKRETDLISFVGTDEKIAEIERDNKFVKNDTAVVLTDDGELKEKILNITENTHLSSSDAIYYAVELNSSTEEEASKMYEKMCKEMQLENQNLPLNYETLKKRVGPTRAQQKLAKIGCLLCLSSKKIKNVFQFKRKN